MKISSVYGYGVIIDHQVWNCFFLNLIHWEMKPEKAVDWQIWISSAYPKGGSSWKKDYAVF